MQPIARDRAIRFRGRPRLYALYGGGGVCARKTTNTHPPCIICITMYYYYFFYFLMSFFLEPNGFSIVIRFVYNYRITRININGGNGFCFAHY